MYKEHVHKTLQKVLLLSNNYIKEGRAIVHGYVTSIKRDKIYYTSIVPINIIYTDYAEDINCINIHGRIVSPIYSYFVEESLFAKMFLIKNIHNREEHILPIDFYGKQSYLIKKENKNRYITAYGKIKDCAREERNAVISIQNVNISSI